MTHIMVDLETWGTTPGSDIRSIGAVVFDPITGTLGDMFYANVHGGHTYGLQRDPDTEKWWSEQAVEAQQALMSEPVFLPTALQRFSAWWASQDVDDVVAKFWANGPSFDEQILAACYRATSVDLPWHYRAPRDMRTICEAAGGVDLPFEGTEHNALHDAVHQAKCVIEAYRKLRAPALAGIELRKAQTAYMENRGDNNLGQRVGNAAQAFDYCVREMGYSL